MKQIRAYTRPRPVIELEGTPFYVDAQWLYLVQVGNPENRIDMHEARSFNDHVELWYDPAIKNAYQGSHSDPPPEHILNYWFHSFSALDPAGAAARLDELNPKWRSVNHTGLPVIDIAGKLFYVDKKDGCFYEVNNCWNWISFNDIACRKKIKGLYINLNSHNTAFPHELNAVRSLTSLPDHIAFSPFQNLKKVKKIIERYLRPNKK